MLTPQPNTWCALALVALMLACGQRGSVTAGDAPVVPLRFPHERHVVLPCTECHAAETVLAGKPERPGQDDHQPCDRQECHRSAFLAAPGELCALCHEGVDITARGRSPLVEYPRVDDVVSMPSSFSHAKHLDFPAMEKTLGFHVSCTDCHELTDGLDLAKPGHGACLRCHAPEAAPNDSPSMTQCRRCHANQERPSTTADRLIRGDLHFEHKRHRIDRRGGLIPCSTCHERTSTTTSIDDHSPPQTRVCVQCHDDSSRVPENKRMSRCETCHATRTARIGALAPRSHMPATERPADHTRAFRLDHAADAKADGPRCAKCHTMLSGSSRDTCDECHQVMRPGDHVVTWREYDHGPEAATRNDRCATCHQVDFCVACHSSPPRSHFPLIDFRQGGHGTQAVLNLRACLTCHRAETCTGVGCHQRSIR